MDWTSEAIATLTTGVLAVIAAWRVGNKQAEIQNRQVGIAERQTKILDRQVALEKLTLRRELFKDRHEIYTATNAILLEILVQGFRGKRVGETPAERAFLQAKDRAKFLFRPSVSDDLQKLWEKFVRGSVLDISIEKMTENGNDASALRIERDEIEEWLNERFRTLGELFGNELSLSDHDTRLG